MSVLDAGIDELLCISEKNVLEEPDWSCLASIRYSVSGGGKPGSSGREDTEAGPLDKYFTLANFQPDVYREAREKSLGAWLGQASLVASKTRSEADNYYCRLLALYKTVISETQQLRGNVQTRLTDDEFIDQVKDIVAAPWITASLPGRDPKSWPYGLQGLIEKMQTLPPFALWLEPFDLDKAFFHKGKEFLYTQHGNLELASAALKALLLAGFLSGSGTKFASALFETHAFCQASHVSEEFVNELREVCQPHVNLLRKVLNKEKAMHYIKPGALMGKFSSPHTAAFQKNQSSANTSLTTDGEYLYLFVGTPNGGKFKIGTGENGTLTGKVYLYVPIERQEDAVWTYCKGKLYMRSGHKETGVVSVICPKTFKTEGMLQLYCPEIFGSAQKQALNRHYPLLSDGESLYVIGMHIETPKQEEGGEEEKSDKKKDPGMCKFTLFKFDESSLQNPNQFPREVSALAKELFAGFSCYFTMGECQRALSINSNDIEAAANWLVEHGEGERDKKTVTSTQSTLLCEATVTSANLSKIQKPELSLKSDTILNPELMRGNWTMSNGQVTLHFINPDGASSTARVFSMSPDHVRTLRADSHVLPNTSNQVGECKEQDFWSRFEEGEPVLHTYCGSHLGNKDCEHNRSVESVLCYDPVHHKFYSAALNWQHGLHFFVFADQARLSERLETSEFQIGDLPHDRFLAEGLKLLQECEANRFNLPWRWMRWTTFYTRVIARFTKIMKTASDPEQTASYQKIIDRLQVKLDKLQFSEETHLVKKLGLKALPEKGKRKKGEPRIFMLKDKAKLDTFKPATDTPHVKVQNGRESLMTLTNSTFTLKVLLKDLEEEGPVRIAKMQLLYLWATHPPLSIPPKYREIIDTEITKLVQAGNPLERRLAWRILILGWEIFCVRPEDELKWFKIMLESCIRVELLRLDSFVYQLKNTPVELTYDLIHKACDDPLIIWYIKHCYNPPTYINERAYNYLATELMNVLVDKQGDSFTLKSANAIMFSTNDNLAIEKTRRNKAHLLEPLWESFSTELVASLSDPSSAHTQVLIEVFIFLLKDSILIDMNLTEQLASLICQLLDRVIELKKDRLTSLYAKWLSRLRHLLNLCVSQSYCNSDPNLPRKLVQILTKAQALFNVDGCNLLEHLLPSILVGADISQEKVFETSHPYQKGKQQLRETINFPGALAICVEIDPRSQTDSSQDCLVLSSPDSQGGAHSLFSENMQYPIKLSGKNISRHLLFLHGDCLNIEFNVTGQREEPTSNRWGFRLKVKPVYGDPYMLLQDSMHGSVISRTAMVFGGETQMLQWISILNNLAFVVSQQIPSMFEYGDQSHPMLDWEIFRGGLINLDTSLLISQVERSDISVPEATRVPEIPETDLVYELLEKIRQVENLPATLRMEFSRKSFDADCKKRWEQLEATCLYVMLWHTQTLESMAKWLQTGQFPRTVLTTEDMQDRLRTLGKKLNEILVFMAKEAHASRELVQIYEDMKEKKTKVLADKFAPKEEAKKFTAREETKKGPRGAKLKKPNVKRLSLSKQTAEPAKRAPKPRVELDENDKKQIFAELTEPYQGRKDTINKLAEVLGTEANFNAILSQLWTRTEPLPNPYIHVAKESEERALILLSFNPYLSCAYHAEDTEEDEEDDLPQLKKAATSYTSEDINKLQKMRGWVDSYKQWKEWQTAGKDLHHTSSPLQAIVTFLTEKASSDILNEAYVHCIRAGKRLIALDRTTELLKAVKCSPFSHLGLGLMPSPSVFYMAECCGAELTQMLNEKICLLFTELVDLLNLCVKRLEKAESKEGVLLRAKAQQTHKVDLYVNKELRLLITLIKDFHSLMNYEASRECVLRQHSSLLDSLLVCLLSVSSLTKYKLHQRALSACKLLSFTVIKAALSISDPNLRAERQSSIIDSLITVSKDLDVGKQEVLLGLFYETIFSCGILQMRIKEEFSEMLAGMMARTTSCSILRVLCKIAKLVFPEIQPLPAHSMESLVDALGRYAAAHLDASPPEGKYSVLLHSTACDESTLFLFPALLEWEERYPSDRYASLDEDDIEAQWAVKFSAAEVLEREAEARMLAEASRGRGKRGKGPAKRPAKPKQIGNGSPLGKLEKAFEEMNKNYEKPKEEDTPEERTRKNQEGAFIRKVKCVLKECQLISHNLLNRGFALVGEPEDLARASELASLLHRHQERLEVDVKNKMPILPVNPFTRPEQVRAESEVSSSKKLLPLSLCAATVAQKIDSVMESGASLPALKSTEKLAGLVTGSYAHSLLEASVALGGGFSLCITEIAGLFHYLSHYGQWRVAVEELVRKGFERLQELDAGVLGALVLAGGWTEFTRPGCEVLAHFNNAKSKGVVAQGGFNTGFSACSVLFDEDSNHTVQSVEVLEPPTVTEDFGLDHLTVAKALTNLEANTPRAAFVQKQLLKVSAKLNWDQWVQSGHQLVAPFVQCIHQLSRQSPTDHSVRVWEERFLAAWEQLADLKWQNFLEPEPRTEEFSFEGFFLRPEDADDAERAYSLSPSSFLTFPPQVTRTTDLNNFRMLKYWEKYIIPRIQDYVRSSFKPFEMEYFFEQLRLPLRSGDQLKAIETAYILCDHRLPAGIVLPDQKHDWNSLMIDEVSVGLHAIAKIKEKVLQFLDNPLVHRLYMQGITQFPVVVRACDVRAASLLVEYTDFDRSEVQLFWLPISSVYPSEVPVSQTVHHQLLTQHFEDLLRTTASLYARQTLLQCMSAINAGQIGFHDIIEAAITEELQFDMVEGWKHCRPDFIPFKVKEASSVVDYIHRHTHKKSAALKLEWVETNLLPSRISEMVDWAVGAWKQMAEEIADNVRLVDIIEVVTALNGPQEPLRGTPENIIAEGTQPRKCFPLHTPGSNYAGIAVSFRKEDCLCSNSTLKFYSDPKGEHLIYQVTAGLRGKGSLSPILFKTGQVWCSYYTFVDIKCNPFVSDIVVPSILKTRVHGIPKTWTQVCWATETTSAALCKSPESAVSVHALVQAITGFLTQSRCSSPLKQILFRLLTRLVRRLRYMNSLTSQVALKSSESSSGTVESEGIGVPQAWLEGLIADVQQWVNDESAGAGTLYSSYIQDAVELIGTCMLPWDVREPKSPALQLETPPWVQAIFKSLVFLNYFRGEGHLPEDLRAEVTAELPVNQWKTVIVVPGLSRENHTRLIEVLGQYKVRVPCSEVDIQYVADHCVVFGDGFSLQYYQETEFGEEEKKEEVEEDSKEAEEIWTCSACTLQNPMGASSCDACGTPKPVAEAPAEPEAERPGPTVRAIDQQLKDNQPESLQELLRALHGAFDSEAVALNIENESHQDLLEKALKQRLLGHDSTEPALPPMLKGNFENSWRVLKPLLGEELSNAQSQLLKLAGENCRELFATLENYGVDLWFQHGLGTSTRTMRLEQLEHLMHFGEFQQCQETRAVLYIPPAFIRLPMEPAVGVNSTQIYPPGELSEFSLQTLRSNWAALKVFNRYISEVIGLCNLSEHSLLPRGSLSLSLSSQLSAARGLVMLPVKTELQQMVFTKTAVSRDNIPSVTLERMRSIENSDKALSFYKAFDQLKDANAEMLRPPKPQGTDPFISFNVTLRGELVVGEAGPYRQFFADVSKEIQWNTTEFLVPIPNDSDKEKATKFLVNPSATSSRHLQMYQFLGLLMGCCARTGTKMTLDLPSFFWKPLVGQNLTFADLALVDSGTASKLKAIEAGSPAFFEEEGITFVCNLSDKSIVDLIPSGRNAVVTIENRDIFIQKFLKCRFLEAAKQAERIRYGISKLVPASLLNLSTWKQLEEWVCGKPYIDLDLLKRHTRLGGGLREDENRVVWLWEILHEFTPNERLMFIKFCWAQERLPVNDEDFDSTNTRFMLKPALNNEYGDRALPKADTCFFNLELFNYSSKEVMKERLRYAVLTDCVGLNGDNPVSEQQEAGMYVDHHYSGGDDEW